MSKIEKLVIADTGIPLGILDEILQKKADIREDELYDLYTFPNLTEILSHENNPLVKNYFQYSINKMLILHPIKQIVFLTNFQNHNKESEEAIKSLFPKKNITFLGYNIVANQFLEFFEDKNKEKYPLDMNKTLIFRCTDGRLSRIYANSLRNKNPLHITNGHYICLPGSTLPLTVCEERKHLIKLIKEYMKDKNNQIEKIRIEHHGPDCGAFICYHQIEKEPDRMRSYEQHLLNIERVWKSFIKSDKDISSLYIELEPKTSRIIEKTLCLKHDTTSEGFISKVYQFDFAKWKTIEFATIN